MQKKKMFLSAICLFLVTETASAQSTAFQLVVSPGPFHDMTQLTGFQWDRKFTLHCERVGGPKHDPVSIIVTTTPDGGPEIQQARTLPRRGIVTISDISMAGWRTGWISIAAGRSTLDGTAPVIVDCTLSKQKYYPLSYYKHHRYNNKHGGNQYSGSINNNQGSSTGGVHPGYGNQGGNQYSGSVGGAGNQYDGSIGGSAPQSPAPLQQDGNLGGNQYK
jgi:hypothetical protein